MSCQHCGCDLRTDGHIHCATCQDENEISDFCFVCFADRVELKNHKASHDYFVIEGLDGDSPDADVWNPAERLRLLDALLKVGVGSWEATAKLVKTKSPSQCELEFLDHYSKRAAPGPGPQSHLPLKEIIAPLPPMTPELHGYLPKRGDFELEFDDAAELAIADLDFSDGCDSDLKMEVLKAYNERLDLRRRVKKFAIERGLIVSASTPGEIELRSKLAPINRFFEKSEDFDTFIKLGLEEKRLMERLADLERVDKRYEEMTEDHVIKKGKLSHMQNMIEQSHKISEAIGKVELKDRLVEELSTEEKQTCEETLNIAPEIFEILKNNTSIGKLLSVGKSGATLEVLLE